MPNVACIDTHAFLAHITVRSAALQVMTTFVSVFIYGRCLLWGALILETLSHHNNMLSLRNAMLIHCLALIFGIGAYGWSKEGHVMTCQIAQSLLKPDVAEAVGHLLPAYAKGDLSSLCTWPDQIRHWHKYLWTSSLHFIDTPDNACSFDYSRDCHDQHGLKNMCVAGALQNFTSQLLHYKEGTADRRYNMTEALLFLSHFIGDIHQPMHVGFSSDEGGNTIELHWFRRKSNLHHVWDRDIILTAAADYYEKDMSLLIQDIEANFTDGVWSDDNSSWTNCEDLLSCPIKYAAESISLACKWAYKGVQPGATLAEDYFDSRMPVVMKRIAQGGVRLAMILNRVLGTNSDEGCTSPT